MFISFPRINVSLQLITLFLLLLLLLLMFTSFECVNQFFSFCACIVFYSYSMLFGFLVRFWSSSVPSSLRTGFYVYPLDARHDVVYYPVNACLAIALLPRTPGSNVYVR